MLQPLVPVMRHVLRIVLLLCVPLAGPAQDQVFIRPDASGQLEFLGETMAYRDWDSTRVFPDERTRPERIGFHAKKDWYLHKEWRADALPQGEDPVLQKNDGTRGDGRVVDLTVDGQLYTSVNPSDNDMAVGPNHVIQMINGSSGAYFRIFNKSGTALGAQTYLDNFINAIGGITTYSGLGDCIVMYDALANRWLMSEFSASGNRLVMCVSSSADPTGTWYAYSITCPGFPDYPKYAVWNGLYVITTNESSPAIYALQRDQMLAGLSASYQRFTVSSYPTIGFQACTPVNFSGGTAPPGGALAMFMRMADDAWSASVPNDRLEIWTMNINWAVPASSVITGPTFLATQAFDTGLCGYTSFSCIDQPGTTINLDPLREVLMNRVQYRHFGTHESIVCNHAVDVNGADRAGVRWYELRRTGGTGNPWSIHQQGTYSPNTESRWMAAIDINANGDIGLAYNVSGASTYPSIRHTGRYASDPLGQMTFTEASIVAGTTYNNSNRYGDYNSLGVDPANGTTFWGTSNYNPTTSWRTRLFAFSLPALNVAAGVKVLLEGPYAGAGSMNDNLRAQGLVPLAEPYTALGYTYVGAGGAGATIAPSVLTVTGNNAIVDWVVLELRSSTTPANVVSSRPALLQRDGDVVALNGTAAVTFDQPPGNYHIAVRHRNHLGTMTASPVAMTGAAVSVDFTSAALSVYGTDARKNVSGVQVLWSGDVTFNRVIGYSGPGNDRDPILLRIGGTVPTNTVTGYFNEDVNLNGEVKYSGGGNDRDPILLNVGGTVPTNTRLEQIP
ncbi:MAG: hypothetical protein JNM31_03455 [Flavobacteriales bacterium]|nr:hypothetical protein [Flavobacteriales bacterium]